MIKHVIVMNATLQTIDFLSGRIINHRGFVDSLSWVQDKMSFLESVCHFMPSDFSINELPGALYLYCHRPIRKGCRKEIDIVYVLTYI